MGMNNNDSASAKTIEALKSMTIEERMAYLKANRADLFAAPVLSFGKAPKDGWKESDRVAK